MRVLWTAVADRASERRTHKQNSIFVFFSGRKSTFNSAAFMHEDGARAPPKPNWVYLTPLCLTLLPVIRVAFKSQPVLRDRLFYGVIFAGILHGATLISSSPAKERR